MPGNVSRVEWSPRWKTPSSPVFGTSRQKRTQRRHRMQRSWSKTMVGPKSTFFLSARRGSRVRERWRVEIPLARFFEDDTVAALAGAVGSAHGREGDDAGLGELEEGSL